MKILISGSHGLIGSALFSYLSQNKQHVFRLIRQRDSSDDIVWDPLSGKIDLPAIEGLDAVIHLAGESISALRWTSPKKHRIRESRIQGTTLLSEALSQLKKPPKVFVCASATGYYGDRGAQELDERSPAGNDFLAQVCQAWEQATYPAAHSDIRVVNLRFGVVFSRQGGALPRLLLPFRLGLGGRIGSGDQYIPWISLQDITKIIDFTISNINIHGPVNVVSPNPITNRQLSKLLGKILNKPSILPFPAFFARLLMGEMAQSLLLNSTRALPKILQENNYKFLFAEPEAALHHIIANNP